MNKKVLLFIAALLITFTTSAQLSFRGGLSLSNFIGKNTNELKAKPGFVVGLGYDYEFVQGIAVQSGIYAISKGSKTDGASTNAIYLQVPLHVATKIDFTPGTRIIIHGGPFAAYGIAGKSKLLEFSGNTFGKEGAKRIDAGVGLGVGAEMGMFLFDFGVDMGLMSPYKNSKNKNMSAYLTVGVRF